VEWGGVRFDFGHAAKEFSQLPMPLPVPEFRAKSGTGRMALAICEYLGQPNV
jgi:hypothetical protein